MKHLLLSLIMLVSCTKADAYENVSTSQEYEVVHVVDGDTIDVMACGIKVRIRLLYINTPERGEKGYKEAKYYLKNRLLGKYVTLVTDGWGSYGRTLANVYLDGVDINQEMFCMGYAVEYRLNVGHYDNQCN